MLPAWPAPDADPGEAWPLLASVHPLLSDDPHTGLPEPRPVPVVRAQFASDWEIDSRPSAIRVLQWLRDEGHGARLRALLERPSSDGAAPRAAPQARLLSAGEAWDFVRQAGERLRSEYDSWAAMGDDYVLGLRWFRPDTAGSDPHVAMVR